MCHCALIEISGFKKSGDPWLIRFKNCAGAEDLQSVDSEHDRLLVNSQCSEHCRHWRVQTENDPLNSTHPERYRHWTDTERYRLNPTDNWILDWTLPTLNNSRQIMNAIDCNPANSEDLDYVCYRLYPIDWTLKKLNWCYRLWTLLALNTIELSWGYGLTLCTLNPTDT